nr:TPA_asm: hypothetical protein [Sphaeridio phenuili virus]
MPNFTYFISQVPQIVVDPLVSSIPYMRIDRMRFNLEDLVKIPHEIPLRYMSDMEETRVKDVIPDIPSDMANLTPDLTIKMNGIIHFVEFGTRILGNEESLKEYASQKINKYQGIIQFCEQANIPATLHVIIVSAHSVVSSLPLATTLVTALCHRYFCAFNLMETIRNQHPELKVNFMRKEAQAKQSSDMNSVFVEVNQKVDHYLKQFKNKLGEVEPVPFEKKNLFRIANVIQNKFNKTVEPVDVSIYNLVEEGGRRDDFDSISRLPMIIPRMEGSIEFGDDEWKALWKASPGHSHVWTAALTEYFRDPNSFCCYSKISDSEPIETVIYKLNNLSTTCKRERNRVTIASDQEAEIDLATLGLFGKKRAKDISVKAKRKWSQQHIHPDTVTDDIDAFIQLFPSRMKAEERELQAVSIDLLNHATPETKYRPSSTYFDLKDNYYTALLFMSDVARECAASSAQSCKSNQFILKKLDDWNCLLLIKTTRSNQHTFVSLLVEENESFQVGSVFPTGTKVGKYMMYNFKSLQFPIMETLLFLPEQYLAVKYMCMVQHNEALLKTLAAGLLIALDNKSDAEEVITKTRYIYMKGITLPLHARNPWTVLEGMPTRPRSRLTLYLLKKAIELCSRVLDIRCLSLAKDKEQWTNIPSYVSPDFLDDWNQVLIVQYMGYFRNKDSFTSNNQAGAMIEKILKPELEYQKDEDYKEHVKKGNSFNPKKMEWNSGFILYAIDVWINNCKRNGIPDPLTHVTDRFLNELSKTRIEDLATLKASNVDTEEEVYELGKKNKPRKKILVVLQSLVDVFGDTMASALPVALEVVARRGGTMMISLFKKAQHGGLREIYVMDLSCRIIQFCMEKLGRIICETIPSEAMTHTNVKLSYRKDHLRKVEDLKDSLAKKGRNVGKLSILTTFDNDDAEKWNQYQCMPKFYLMLKSMTLPVLHGFLKVGLSMWMNKRIRLDDKMLDSMATGMFHPRSPVLAEVTEAFKGNIVSPVIEEKHKDLIVESGMMQGLLHFVSSALHGICLMAYNSLLPDYIERCRFAIYRTQNRSVFLTVINTHAVTSDDSISANSIITTLEPQEAIKFGTTGCSALKLACSQMCGIVSSSKKAAFGTAPISEFNSQWMDRTEVVRPQVRHVLACFNYNSIGNFMEQQDELSSLRQQAVESGACIHLVSLINFLQGLCFYRILGSRSSSVFNRLAQYYKRLPDPNLGYFMIDPPMLSGIVSTDYNAYMLATRTLLGTRYSTCVKDTDMLAGSSGSLRASTECAIEFIKTQKMAKLRAEVDVESANKYIEDHPDLLYRAPRNIEETKVSLTEKLTSMKVLKSLSMSSNVGARQLASSVYILWAKIVRSNRSVLQEIAGLPINEEKTSIANMLIELVPLLENLKKQGYGVMSHQAKCWFFPLYQQFDELSFLNKELETRVPFGFETDPRAPTIIEVLEGRYDDIPLMQLCSYKWFGIKHRATSDFVYESYFKEAKEAYPFLADTHEETLRLTNFERARELRTVIEKTILKSKSLRPTSRGGRATRTAGLSSFVSYNFIENKVLKVQGHEDKDDEIRTRLRRMAMILQIPYSSEDKKSLILKEINKSTIETWRSARRYAPLCLIHKNAPDTITLSKVMRLCRHSKICLGVWTVPQVKDHGKWYGDGWWKGCITNEGDVARLVIHVNGKRVEEIYTDNLIALQRSTTALHKLFSSWGVETSMKSKCGAYTYFYKEFGSDVGTPVYYTEDFAEDDLFIGKEVSLEISEKTFLLGMDSVPFYEFFPRPDMIQESKVNSRRPIDYILNNSPMPVELAISFLQEPAPVPRYEEVRKWCIKMIKDKMPKNIDSIPLKVVQEEKDIEAFFANLDLTDDLASFTTLMSDLAGWKIEEDAYSVMCAATYDYDEEHTRLFEALSDKHLSIYPSHFQFLRDIIQEAKRVVYFVDKRSHAITERERFLYKLISDEEVAMKAKVEIDWEEEDGLDELNETRSDDTRPRTELDLLLNSSMEETNE